MSAKNKRYIGTGLVFAFFVFSMVFHLMHSALWGDEWVEYEISRQGLLNRELLHSCQETYQPPLYNVLMHFWLMISDSILWFRLFNVVLGCIAGVLLYLTVEKVANTNAALFSLIGLAASYQWVYCIQECSEYALMLCFLFALLFFYVRALERFSYLKMCAFLASAIGAIYSQYGAVFVAVPLLALFYGWNLFSKETSWKRRGCVTGAYLACLLGFAVPLYYFFARVQMGNNEIAGETKQFSIEMVKEFPVKLGQTIGYFYKLYTEDAWQVLFGILGIVILFVSLAFIIRGTISWIQKSLFLALWMGYVVYYILIKLNIYGKAHAGSTAGFFGRYSYFYIPLFCVTLPILVTETGKWFAKWKNIRIVPYVAGALAVCMFWSFCETTKNWNKALDDQFAVIWMEHEGWTVPTYLYGTASYGFNYYISHSEGYKDGYLDEASTEVDNDHLPKRFWAWRTNWGGEGWQETVDRAKELGYTVTVYKDKGYSGQLAYCFLEE